MKNCSKDHGEDTPVLLREFQVVTRFFLLSPLLTTTLSAADHLRTGNIEFAIKIALAGVVIQLLVFATFAVGYKIIRWTLR